MLDAFLQVRNLQHHEAAVNLFVEKDGCAVNDASCLRFPGFEVGVDVLGLGIPRQAVAHNL